MTGKRETRRRWRFYETASGNAVVKKQLDALSDEDAAEVVAAMKEIERTGLSAGRHLRGDVYEVKADTRGIAYRMLFGAEGEQSQVLLALELISKKSQKTPKATIDLAEKRLRKWRERGRALRASPSRRPNPRGRSGGRS